MTYERFEHLADAYGGDLRRWPEGEREAARRLLDNRPDLAARLQAERNLDDLMDAAPRLQPSMALHDQVLASAIQAGRGRWRQPRPLAWIAGAGWAAAACAGALSGLALTGHITADARAEAVYAQAAFGAIDDAEVLG